jgi:hypothetical protein
VERTLLFDHLGGGDKQRLWGGQTRLASALYPNGLALSLGTVNTLGEGQELESAGCDARSGEREQLT